MYFAQGVPWGYMVTALGSYLASRDVSDADVGDLTAMVLLPWTFKLVWGPVIDTVTIRSLGRRRPWIIGAELMMAVSLLGLLMLGDISDDLRLLGWMFFIHNCFASLQDVSTDALAVDILPADEQGKTNGLMWGSKLLGKAVGASGMALVIRHFGLPASVLLQFVILLLIMLFPIFMLERPGDKRFPWSRPRPPKDATVGAGQRKDATSVRRPAAVFRDMVRAFSLATTWVFAIFGTFHVIGWGIIEVIHKTLYTQKLGWEFDQLAHISGLAVLTELIGACLGGFLADRFGRRKIMVFGFTSYGLAAIVFGSCPGLWDERWFTAGYLLVNPGLLAMGAVGFLSMAMRISWTRAAATVFTVYMTVSNVGHVIGNKLVGSLRGDLQLSYEHTFWYAGLITLLPLLLLLVVRPQEVDERRNRELSDIAAG
jgi:PAT family beta-lactamase induction signal transducer AmpG